MIALMYCETRKPPLSRMEFVARWRKHGALALSYPGFRRSVTRYVHRDPIHQLPRFAGTHQQYDALGEIVTPDLATMSQLLASDELTGPIRDDGAVTFGRTETINAIVEESYLRDHHLAAISVSTFLAARPGTADLLQRVREFHERLPTGCAVDRLARRIGISGAVGVDAAWAVYIDLAFDSIADAESAFGEWKQQFREISVLTERQVTLVTVRCPLYDPAALS